ncbi:hypothetical protein L873DRAFT_1802099 [Choiromyces venosus 120613-1]|uniref:Uncharacterized protein n=1 Tax=Choiromyces venosus 120613-1 TaxID=1336337 RepID=A0A3N4JWC1_9PEZI|nr:hypothetical protein L873DRAFT_1802099 [Choiromyces venosus 120613-1]
MYGVVTLHILPLCYSSESAKTSPSSPSEQPRVLDFAPDSFKKGYSRFKSTSHASPTVQSVLQSGAGIQGLRTAVLNATISRQI